MLHVLVGAQCNNNCAFCMESDRAGRARHLAGQSPSDVERMIAAYPDRSEILFTSGEPTLSSDLPGYIAAARRAGFGIIGLITNGRRLAYRDYAARLVGLGLSKVTVSIHGPSARIHDGLTRVRGSFEQTRAGLDNLAALKAGTRLDLHTSTVVVRRNLDEVGAIRAMLQDAGVDRMCFNVMMLKGRGLEKLDWLMARYRDIAARFRALAEGLDREQIRRVSLADIPPCTVEGLAFELVGDQERFEQFEPLGSNGIACLSAEQLERLGRSSPERQAPAERLAARASGAADLSADADYYLTSRELKDNILRIKRAECRACRHLARCPGIWEAYVQRHGWEEFEPIQAARS